MTDIKLVLVLRHISILCGWIKCVCKDILENFQRYEDSFKMKCKTVVWFRAGGVPDKPQSSVTATTLMKTKMVANMAFRGDLSEVSTSSLRTVEFCKSKPLHSIFISRVSLLRVIRSSLIIDYTMESPLSFLWLSH